MTTITSAIFLFIFFQNAKKVDFLFLQNFKGIFNGKNNVKNYQVTSESIKILKINLCSFYFVLICLYMLNGSKVMGI